MSASPIGWLASGFGAGRAPLAPGTFGTLVGIPIALLLSLAPLPGQVLLVLALLPFAAWVCGAAERSSGHIDPGWIVLDEIVGFCIATLGLAPAVGGYLAAFLLFRLFDILKPPPANWVDSRVRGGWGILLDDVLAGVYARAVLFVLGG